MFSIHSHTSKRSESIDRLMEKLAVLGVTTLHYGNGVDKLDQYAYFKEHNIPSPDFTTDYDSALEWINNGFDVVARTLTQGHAGHGVQVVSDAAHLPAECKVYTKYIKKKREFRVNIFGDKVVNVREKKRQAGATGDGKIRSQSNGYTTTFASNVPQQVKDLALLARKVSDSDFVGVDVIYNQYYDQAYVLEVNSGPSIEGQSVNDFAQAILEKVNAN